MFSTVGSFVSMMLFGTPRVKKNKSPQRAPHHPHNSATYHHILGRAARLLKTSRPEMSLPAAPLSPLLPAVKSVLSSGPRYPSCIAGLYIAGFLFLPQGIPPGWRLPPQQDLADFANPVRPPGGQTTESEAADVRAQLNAKRWEPSYGGMNLMPFDSVELGSTPQKARQRRNLSGRRIPWPRYAAVTARCSAGSILLRGAPRPKAGVWAISLETGSAS